MTSRSTDELQPRELSDYALARARDIAFDAVIDLWRRRRAEGMKQKELAAIIGADPSTVSKNLRGPGNWTLRTLGEMVEGLDGNLMIFVEAVEDQPTTGQNYYSAYDELEGPAPEPEPFGESRGTPESAATNPPPIVLYP